MSEETTQPFPKDGFQILLARFDTLENTIGQLGQRIISLEDKVDKIDQRLTTLEEKVDRRLMETRPIWEQVLVRLESVETRLGSVETRLGSVETRLGSVETRMESFESYVHGRFDSIDVRFDRVDDEISDLNRKFRLFLKDLLKYQLDQDDLTERVDKLAQSPVA